MFEFISKSLKLADKNKNKMLAGIFFVFIQNFSLLLNFTAIYFAFRWLDSIDKGRIITIFFILLVSFLFNFVSNWFQNKLIAGVFFSVYKDYRLKVGDKLKNAPMGYFNETSLSKILSCFTNVLRNLENFSQVSLTFTISGISISFFLLLGLFNMNKKIGFIALIFVLLTWLCVYFMFKASKNSIREEHRATSDFNDSLVDGIRGIPVLRSFPMISDTDAKQIHSRVYEGSEKIADVQSKFEVKFTIYSRIYRIMLDSFSLITTLYVCKLYMQGQVSLAEAMTISVASFMLFGGLKQLEGSAILMVKNPENLNYLNEILDIPQIVEGTIEKIGGEKNITFENVNFSYEKDRQIIKDLSFELKEGSKTAIVGPSGSGKTTIINLLSRFYDVDSGAIKIGGKNIKDYKIDTLLGEMSLVFQDVYLFSDTVKNNIKFANPNASDEQIIEAAKRAKCHDFIMEMPNAYDTIIGEGGSNISGGEKQRISIARALLKNASIILLDEATSSVDPENEYEIMQALDELCKDKTVITIAHRLSTVKDVDNILVIENGRLVQSGSHEELLKKEGIYKTFIDAKQKAQNWSIA